MHSTKRLVNESSFKYNYELLQPIWGETSSENVNRWYVCEFGKNAPCQLLEVTIIPTHWALFCINFQFCIYQIVFFQSVQICMMQSKLCNTFNVQDSNPKSLQCFHIRDRNIFPTLAGTLRYFRVPNARASRRWQDGRLQAII